jgi:hypothetical protein
MSHLLISVTRPLSTAATATAQALSRDDVAVSKSMATNPPAPNRLPASRSVEISRGGSFNREIEGIAKIGRE